MQILIQMVRQIAMLTLFAVFVEMLLPKGDMQKFARMVMGLLLLVVVLNPLLAVLETSMPQVGSRSKAYDAETTAVLQQGAAVAAAATKQEAQTWQEEMATQITATVVLLPGVEKAAIRLQLTGDGPGADSQRIKSMDIGVVYEKNGREKISLQELQEYLAGLYGLSAEKIAIKEGI